MDSAISVNGVPIRLTAERWTHIVEARDELAGRMDEVLAAVEDPDWITRGYHGALVAWKAKRRKRFLTVIYKELSKRDGFVVTAFFTSKPQKRNRLWP
ncbi:MAG: hypothetical protein V3W34_06960 [Phycisphaerae bacterium]